MCSLFGDSVSEPMPDQEPESARRECMGPTSGAHERGFRNFDELAMSSSAEVWAGWRPSATPGVSKEKRHHDIRSRRLHVSQGP